MSIKRFFQRLIDSEVCGEEMVATQVKCYSIEAACSPKCEPHEILMKLWFARLRSNGHYPPSDDARSKAFIETMQFSCLPYPDCARTLGLWFIAAERPDIIQEYPKFSQEFRRIMTPVYQTIESDTFFDLYRKYNPVMAANSALP